MSSNHYLSNLNYYKVDADAVFVYFQGVKAHIALRCANWSGKNPNLFPVNDELEN